jgi:hypothetical protein
MIILSGLGLMANRFDAVPVGTNDERRLLVRVVVRVVVRMVARARTRVPLSLLPAPYAARFIADAEFDVIKHWRS